MNKEFIKIGNNYIISDNQGALKVLQTESGKILEQKLNQENKVESILSSIESIKTRNKESKIKLKKSQTDLNKGRVRFTFSCFLAIAILIFLCLITKVTATYFLTLILPFSLAGIYCLVEAYINFIGRHKIKVNKYKDDIAEENRMFALLTRNLSREREKLDIIENNFSIKYIENVNIRKILDIPQMVNEKDDSMKNDNVKSLNLNKF